MAKTKTPYKSLNVRLNVEIADWFEKYCDQVGWSKTTGVERMMLYYKKVNELKSIEETLNAPIKEERDELPDEQQ